MKTRRWNPTLLSLVLCGALAFTACERITDADKEAALETVRKNTEAMEKENLDEALATIHPKCPTFEQSREQMKIIFAKWDLKYEIEELKIGLATPDSIHVGFRMIARRVSGDEELEDSEVAGDHILKRDGKKWKIWDTRPKWRKPAPPLPEE